MDLVEKSNATLRRIEQNDPKLTVLSIVNRDYTTTRSNCFWVHDGAGLSRLGHAIANNTNLKKISFHKSSEWGYNSTAERKAFFDGLKQNTTIKHLWLKGGIGHGSEIFYEVVANNSNLEQIRIHRGDVRGGVARSLASAVKKCSNLNDLDISMCIIDDASLKDIALGIRGLSRLEKLSVWNSLSSPNESNIGIGSAESVVSVMQDSCCNLINLDLNNMRFNNECIQIIIDSLRGNTKLKRLGLSGNNVGSSGCDSIGTFLENPTCNLTEFHLGRCGINSECILKIVTSLMSNTKLEHIDLSGNKNIERSGYESIATLLQDANSNINTVDLYCTDMTDEFASLLAQALVGNNKLKFMDLSGNSDITESGWNAFSAILSNCSNHTLLDFGDEDDIDNMPLNLLSLLKLNRAVDMEPLFELDEDDERKPKALPCVIDWFDRRVRESNEDGELVNSINSRKLSCIFQFARAMPLKFVPASHFIHPSVVSLIQLKEGRNDDLESKNRELSQKNTELKKEIATKEAAFQLSLPHYTPLPPKHK